MWDLWGDKMALGQILSLVSPAKHSADFPTLIIIWDRYSKTNGG
jgi:hypothetical protein